MCSISYKLWKRKKKEYALITKRHISFFAEINVFAYKKHVLPFSPTHFDFEWIVINIYMLFIKTIEFMFAGINMFWARLRLILAWAVRRGLKWTLRRAQNIFMPKSINSITIIITLEGIERINTEKMTTKRSEEDFISPAMQGNVNKLWNGFSILIGCLHRMIIGFSFFIGSFQRAKIHLSPANSPF